MLFTVTSTKDLPAPPTGSNVNIVYGNLKSEKSQDYAQKPQRNSTFMNSASGKKTPSNWRIYRGLNSLINAKFGLSFDKPRPISVKFILLCGRKTLNV